MPDLGDTLGRQVGPLPLGLWIVAGVAGVGIAVYANRVRGREEDDGEVEVAPGSLAAGGLDPLAPPVPGGAVGLPTFTGPDTGGSSERTIETQGEWEREAATFLIARGNSATLVQRALAKFLTGRVLTREEEAIVELALREFGPPPGGAPPVQVGEPPDRGRTPAGGGGGRSGDSGSSRPPSIGPPTGGDLVADIRRNGNIRRGEQSPRVRLVQVLLTARGVPTGQTGRFGPATERQVRVFQRRVGVGVNGEVGPVTARALVTGRA